MRDIIDRWRQRIEDECIGSETRALLEEMISELESLYNSDLEGSVIYIRPPLSHELKWFFMLGPQRAVPIESHPGIGDGDRVKMTVLLSRMD